MTTFYCCYNVNNQLMEINANYIIFHENHGAEARYQRLSLSSTAFRFSTYQFTHYYIIIALTLLQLCAYLPLLITTVTSTE